MEMAGATCPKCDVSKPILSILILSSIIGTGVCVLRRVPRNDPPKTGFQLPGLIVRQMPLWFAFRLVRCCHKLICCSGSGARIQVSLLTPPFWIETVNSSVLLSQRVSPPGITAYPSFSANRKARRIARAVQVYLQPVKESWRSEYIPARHRGAALP